MVVTLTPHAATSKPHGSTFKIETIAQPDTAESVASTSAATTTTTTQTPSVSAAVLLAAAVTYLSQTSSTYPAMVKRYGADWRKWPQGSSWWKALNAIDQARS